MEQNLTTFEQIYRSYYRQIYSFLYKMCLDESLAETLTQETFYHSYRSLAKYSGKYDLYAFISAIAYKMFLKHLKNQTSGTITVDLYVTDPDAPLEDDPGYRISKTVEISKLVEALRLMPQRHSEILVLHIYGEVPYEDLAAKHRLSVNAVKAIYREAKIILKENLINE